MAWGWRSWAYGPGPDVRLVFTVLVATVVGLPWYRLGLMEVL